MADVSIPEVLAIATFAVSLGSGLYTWVTTRDKATQREIKDVQDKVHEVEKRVGRAESEMAHLPDKESLHRVELAVSEVRGDLRSMLESWAPVQRTVTRLEEYLMDMKTPRNGGTAARKQQARR